MFTVYVIENKLGIHYTGFTSDMVLRLKEHNFGKPGNYTYKLGPWKIVFSEEYETKGEAFKREKFLKSGQGRVFLKQLLNPSRDRAIGSSQGS